MSLYALVCWIMFCMWLYCIASLLVCCICYHVWEWQTSMWLKKVYRKQMW
jgi:hypothetical protein